MPCEGCNIQFTVFKRKRQCSECRRYFCNNCLTKLNQNILCERCAIFAKRPLTKSDLLSLKAKDLLYFLHSKHISTAGYVEKEELVNLILHYIEYTDVNSMPSNGENGDMNNTQTTSSVFSSNTIDVDTLGGRSSKTTTNNTTENFTNPFDQWKQTCQNFFTSFTDRISNDLGFDNSRQHPKTSSTPSSSSSSSKLNQTFYNVPNDTATIKIPTPTYYESMNRNSVSISKNTIPTKAGNRRKNVPNKTETVSSTYANTNHLSSSSPSSSMSSQSISFQTTVNTAQQQSNNEHNKSENKVNDFSSLSPSSQFHHSDSQTEFENIADNISCGDRNIKMINKLALNDNYSGCDCSDNEIITEFNTREQKLNINKPSLSSISSSSSLGLMIDNCLPTSQSDLIFGNHDAGPSSSNEIITEFNTREQKLNINKPSLSSISSSSSLGLMIDNCLPTSQSDLIFGNHDAGPSSSNEIITEFNTREQKLNINKPSLSSISSSSSLGLMLDNCLPTSQSDLIFGNHDAGPSSSNEIITEFNTREQKLNINKPSLSSISSSSSLGLMLDNCLPTTQRGLIFGNYDTGPSSFVTRSDLNSNWSNENNQVRSSGGSSGSSFEELGAVGGGGTISDNENWQQAQVDLSSFCDFTERNRDNNWPRTEENHNPLLNNTFPSYNASNFTDRLIQINPSCSSNQQNTQQEQIHDSQQEKTPRGLIRRRSNSFDYEMEAGPSTSNRPENKLNNNDRSDRKSHKRRKKCCSKCGKSKKNIQEHIEKFKRQLESSVLTQSEIRHSLNSFIQFLEQKDTSFDCSDDSEGIQDNDDIYNGSNDNRNDHHNGINNDNSSQSNEELQVENNEMDGDNDGEEDNNGQSEPQLLYENENASADTVPLNLNGRNDGIYAYTQEDLIKQQEPPRVENDSRSIDLKNIESSSELDKLSVIEIKKLLALNRVNYYGFCEKQELLEKLKSLWKEIRSCPDAEKLSNNNLCNICMDAPIECVFLECGHSTTCVNCGKVLSECPMCRAYIVRLVRCFRS